MWGALVAEALASRDLGRFERWAFKGANERTMAVCI